MYICPETQVEGAAVPWDMLLSWQVPERQHQLYHTNTFNIMPANVSTAEAGHIVKSNVNAVEKCILPILVHDEVT